MRGLTEIKASAHLSSALLALTHRLALALALSLFRICAISCKRALVAAAGRKSKAEY